MTIDLNEYVANSWTKEISYLSFSYSLPKRKLAELFYQAQEYKGSRFFWSTPNRKDEYVGIGIVEKYHPKNALELAIIKNEFFKKLLTVVPQKGAPLLFGGLPFDVNGPQESFWEEMEKGYFLLPEILFQLKASKLQVTLTVKASSKEEAIHNLTELKLKVERLLKQKNPLAKSAKFIMEERSAKHFLSLAAETVKQIKADETLKKVVLARQMILTGSAFETESILSNLLEQQPNTYVFALESANRIFIGATPERLLKATDDHYATASIAGSAPRGKNQKEDMEIGESLLKDFKNGYEHQLVVECIQKQLAPYTEEKPHITIKSLLKNRDIQHLFIPLKGRRKVDSSFLEVMETLHPTPALGGEPKEKALEWIAQKEKRGRGLYGAPIGWVSLIDDVGEFAVGIRSGVFSSTKALLYAGCGIVEDSVPEEERKETRLKFQPMIRGVKGN